MASLGNGRLLVTFQQSDRPSDDNWYLTAEEALNRGLVSGIFGPA